MPDSTVSIVPSALSKNQILLSAAEACLDQGWAIIPLAANSKEPFSVLLNPQGNVQKTYNGIRSVISASFGSARKYITRAGTEKWTTAALQTWWDGLDCNVGIALWLSDLTVLDIDEGIESEEELLDFLTEMNIPVTRCVKSGRVSSFGAHLYFAGKMASGSFSIPWHNKFVKGEIKSEHKYVASEGSFHKSGQQYRRIWDKPLTETPTVLFENILSEHPLTKVKAPEIQTPAVPFDGTAVTPEQFEKWCEKTGEDIIDAGFNATKNAHMYLRAEGCPWKDSHTTPSKDDSDFAVFIGGKGLSVKCCHESCKAAWTESSGWKSYKSWVWKKFGKEVPLQDWGHAYVGKGVLPKMQGISGDDMSEMPETETTEVETTEPKHVPLVYPIGAWEGTLYHEFAELCTQGNYIPKEFCVESLKTVIGAIVGKNLAIANIDGGLARFYTVLIALPSVGKNTIISWTTSLFEQECQQGVSDKDFSQYKLLWHPQEKSSNPELGACLAQASSASGLAKFLPTGKGEGQDRLLFRYTELATLLEKCGIDGSGTALISALCDLYDSTEFSIPALSEQKPFGGNLQLSILSGIQPERWAELGSGKGVENSGIHSRWNLVPSEESKTVSDLERPDFTQFQAKIRALLSHAAPLIADADARAVMKVWHNELVECESNKAHIARLNIIAWRNALHHAWLMQKPAVDADSVAVGIAVANYQLLARKRYAPLIGDSPIDKAINAIRRHLQKNGAVSLSQLKRGVNYKRYNLTFEKALAFLFRMAEIEEMNGLVRLKEETL
jgi:hypothetical protein